MPDLIVSTHTPTLGSGRALRTYAIARALAMNGGATLLYARFGAEQPHAAFESVPGLELRAVQGSRGPRRLLRYARARLDRVPRDFARGVWPELQDAARELAPSHRLVIADGPVAAASLSGLARDLGVGAQGLDARGFVYNAHNLESGFRHELHSSAGGGLRGLGAFERRLLAQARESWMVSLADMRAAHELCPGARLRLVPNVVDVAAIEPLRELAPEPRAILVADFSYEPNRNALRFLLEQVMPLVWQRMPTARLAVAGRGLERDSLAGPGLERDALAEPGLEHNVLAGPEHDGARCDNDHDPRVEALGFVEDLASAYRTARCAVVPLLQGGGSPLKLIEALAYGLPVVATSRAVAGLHVTPGEHLLLADGPHELAQALTTVLANGDPELGRAGRRLAEERYSIEALAALLRS